MFCLLCDYLNVLTDLHNGHHGLEADWINWHFGREMLKQLVFVKLVIALC